MKLRFFKLVTTIGSTLVLSSSILAEDSLFVQVRSTKIRSQPEHWAAAVSDARYGDKLKPITDDEDSAWLEVGTLSGKKGFINRSAVSKREIVLNTSKLASVNADLSEVVVAGKGFGKEVEQDYAMSSSNVDYRAVNKMETLRVSDPELLNFMKEGQLRIAGK
ncbi:MAG: SH3 domain-containing protein [bacterium]|nr:SH3 domain-containing protein [bacterium]